MKTFQVDTHEAKARLSGPAKRAWRGERVTIAKAGEPHLDPLPHGDVRPPREPGRFEGRIRMADDLDVAPDEVIDAFGGES